MPLRPHEGGLPPGAPGHDGIGGRQAGTRRTASAAIPGTRPQERRHRGAISHWLRARVSAHREGTIRPPQGAPPRLALRRARAAADVARARYLPRAVVPVVVGPSRWRSSWRGIHRPRCVPFPDAVGALHPGEPVPVLLRPVRRSRSVLTPAEARGSLSPPRPPAFHGARACPTASIPPSWRPARGRQQERKRSSSLAVPSIPYIRSTLP